MKCNIKNYFIYIYIHIYINYEHETVYSLQFICLIDKHLYAREILLIVYYSFLSGTQPAIEILILLSPVSLEMVSIAT